MTKQIDYQIAIKTAYNSNFTITNVLSAPRQCRPVDVKAALAGIELFPLTAKIPDYLSAVVSFIIVDFFALAHSTGLYNRQKMLWESSGRVVQVDIYRPRTGIFRKKSAPCNDLHFIDSQGNILIFCSMADMLVTDKDRKTFVKGALTRAENIHKKQGFLHGIFLALDSPMPEVVSSMVAKMTNAADPVGRYESMLPEPINAPLNLLAVDRSAVEACRVVLAHPYLKTCVSQSSR
jgi:hypothetical protein